MCRFDTYPPHRGSSDGGTPGLGYPPIQAFLCARRSDFHKKEQTVTATDDPPPTADHWVRLTHLADAMGLTHAAARDIHEGMGRPHEQIESGRGRAVRVNSPYWLRSWRWYYCATERMAKLKARNAAARHREQQTQLDE